MIETARSTSRLLASLVVLTCLTSCYRATFHRDPTVTKGETHEEWTDFFLFGLVGTEEFSVQEFCPDANVAEVKTGGNFATGIVGAITIGIYTPRKVYVSCAEDAERSARHLELNLDGSGEPVHAELTSKGRTQLLAIDAAGEQQWRLSLKEGSDK